MTTFSTRGVRRPPPSVPRTSPCSPNPPWARSSPPGPHGLVGRAARGGSPRGDGAGAPRRPSRNLPPAGRGHLHLPFEVADYVDFYAWEHHAPNVGQIFRPDAAPLTPNWKHLPIGYHGRAGTVVVSGTDVVRPSGQRKAPDRPAPVFGPSVRLDIEAEVGFVVGVGSRLGEPVALGGCREHVFGVVLLNDWSARDIQAWEYVPLGPFLGKTFATSISAGWSPLDALDAARCRCPARSRSCCRTSTSADDVARAARARPPVEVD